MKREVEILIPAALRAVEGNLLKDEQEKIAYKEYDGYAASLGAAIRMSGLLPALSFYSDVHKGTSMPRRYTLLVAILETLGEKVPEGTLKAGRELLRRVISEVYGASVFTAGRNQALPTMKQAGKERLTEWEDRILHASVALKLALRSYQHTTEDND